MIHTRCIVSFLATLCAAAGALGQTDDSGDDSQRPAALIALENSRNALLTAHIEWSVRSNRSGDQFERPRNFTSRFAGDDYLLEDRGDADGVLLHYNRDGEPPDEFAKRRNRWLVYDGKQWEKREKGIMARVQLVPTDVIDVRALGMATDIPYSTSYHRSVWGSGQPRKYQIRQIDGLYEVTVTTADSGWTNRWLIDPERGWNAVRITLLSKSGKFLAEERSTLKKYGDVWFPSRTEIYRSEFKDGKEPLYVFEVSRASFNQPEHPLRLTPEDIEIEVGTPLRLYANSAMRDYKTMGWDGKKLISQKEMFARIQSGELRQGPHHMAAVRRSTAMGRGVDTTMRLLEVDTRRFIKKYRLKKDQAQRAMTILKDCRELVKQHGTRKKGGFADVRKRVAAAEEDTSLSPKQRAVRLDKLAAEMTALERPLQKIRYLRLWPRLNKLPTRAQKKAAAEREYAEQDG